MKLIYVILLVALAKRAQGNSLLCYVCDGDECESDETIRILNCGPQQTTTTPAYTTIITETTPDETDTTSGYTRTTPDSTETVPDATETTQSPTESTPADLETTSVPTETTQVPAESTPTIPTESTQAPAENTPTINTESTSSPSEPTSAPAESTQAATESTSTVSTEPTAKSTPGAESTPTTPAEASSKLTESTVVATEKTTVPSSETNLRQKRSISASSVLINNYRRISRTRRDSDELSYSCYSVEYKDGDKVKQRKGCVAIPTEKSACQVVAEKVENIVESSCKPCTGELCNSSSMLRLSILTLLVAIFVKIIM